MAIKNDINGLKGKTENNGENKDGRLTAKEWNQLVDAVTEVQEKVEGTIKGIKYNGGKDAGGQTFYEIDDEGYLKMDVSSSSGDVAIFTTSKPANYISSDSNCNVTFYVSSKVTQNGINVPAPVPCRVNFYINNGNGNDVLVGKDTIYDFEHGDSLVKKEITFDFAAQTTKLNTSGADNILTIEVNNGYGTITKELFVVRVISMQLSVDYFDKNKVYNSNKPPQVRATIFSSSIDKANIYAEVDGKRIISDTIVTGTPWTSGDNPFINAGVNTHGVHHIKIWGAVEIPIANDDPIVISTQTKEFDYIYGTQESTPIVMADITNKTPEQYTTFNVSYIAYKYDSRNVNIEDNVVTGIYEIESYNNGKPIIGRKLISTEQTLTFNSTTNSASGVASLSLFPVTLIKEDGTPEVVNILGEMAIVISIGDYQYVDTINVTKSSIELSAVGDYAVYLTSNGRSNKEANKRIWESVGIDENRNQLITEMIFNDSIEFESTGSGWAYDNDKYDTKDPNDNGNVALRLKKGKKCELNYKPFAKNVTFDSNGNLGTGTGMTISIEFATRNSLNQQASVISCIANEAIGQPRGFEILANKATLYSKNKTLFADFKEDTRIKLDIVIDGAQYPYSYDTVWTEEGGKGETVSATATENEALCIMYVDGVYQALCVIPEGDSFKQANPVNILFGSDECDLDIYNVRIYNFALTPMQIVQNYAYDTPNVKNKIAIATRNKDVLTINPDLPQKPNINIEALRIARPDLPLFFVEMDNVQHPTEELPKNKSNWMLMKTTKYDNPNNTSNQTEGNASFEIPFAVMRNQGTSSMTYPWPWRNWDWKTKDDKFPEGEGYFYLPTVDSHQVKTKYWAQYKGMNNIDSSSGKGNIRKITLKKDYASSEMCNNAITSEYFTDMANGIANQIPGVLSPAQLNNGTKDSPYRLTFVAQPCVMFRKYNDATKEGSAGKGYEALGMMNLIPNKNECAYLGFYGDYTWDGNGKRAQSWELSDNYAEYFWKTNIDVVQRNVVDGKYTNYINGYYEARYPKDTTVFFKTNENTQEIEADGDFGMISKSTITKEECEDVQNEQRDLVEFHNWLVSTNRQIPIDYKAGIVDEKGNKILGEDGNPIPASQRVPKDTYRELDKTEISYEWNNGQYKYDTPEYRLAKFKAEAETRLLIDQFCLYYVWREMFWAYDSGLKNLQIYTMGEAKVPEDKKKPDHMQWGCMVRDADTTLGIQNQGRIEFPPYLEDTDFYTETNGVKTWYFDALRDKYDQSDILTINAQGQHILNGQLAPLWINLRDAFGDRIENIYTALHNNSEFTNWTANKAIKRFRDHQEKWCESLYNFGMRQYFGGKPFNKWIDSGLGDKKNSRASWLSQAFYYRDSKYGVLSDYLAVRWGCYNTPDFTDGHTQNQPLHYKLYQPAYLLLAGDEIDPKSCKTRKRITDVNNVKIYPKELLLEVGANSNMNVQYGTNNIVELGDLARVCKIFEIQDWSFPKLRSLLLGHEYDRDQQYYHEYVTNEKTGLTESVPISNSSLKNIDLSRLTQLQIIDLTNHINLPNIDASKCTELKEFYAAGCDSATTITLPQTSTLETIYLPYVITSINFENLNNIKKFKLATPPSGQSYGVTKVKIVNCGDYLGMESFNIVNKVYDNLKNQYDSTGEMVCELTGINWTPENNISVTQEDIKKLYDIKAKLKGVIKLDPNKNNGALHGDLKVKLVERYGDIDDPTNSLHIIYTRKTIENIHLPSKIYIHEPGDHKIEFDIIPDDANTYKNAVWELTEHANGYATIDSTTGVITRTDKPATEDTDPAKLTVTVSQIDNVAGEALLDKSRTVDVYFYERKAKPGDIVYHDGSFSDEYDTSKTPIGVCFYVDPENKYNRLMVALNNVRNNNSDCPSNNADTFRWTTWGVGQYSTTFTSRTPKLKDNLLQLYGFSATDIQNVKKISVNTDHGLPNNTTNLGDVENWFEDKIYRDDNKKDKFRTFISSSGATDKSINMNAIGWDDAKDDVTIDDKKVIVKGNNYPIGYIKTLAIIEHRNKVLSIFKKQGINSVKITGNIVNDSGDIITSEYTNIFTDIKNAEGIGDVDISINNENMKTLFNDDWLTDDSAIESHKKYVSCYLYPAASFAYAYEPGVEISQTLDDKFKQHNWFLPAPGDAARIAYYIQHAIDGSLTSKYDDAKSFKYPIDNITTLRNGWSTNNRNFITTCAQWTNKNYNDYNYCIRVKTNGIYTGSNNFDSEGIAVNDHKAKASQSIIRPICAF